MRDAILAEGGGGDGMSVEGGGRRWHGVWLLVLQLCRCLRFLVAGGTAVPRAKYLAVALKHL